MEANILTQDALQHLLANYQKPSEAADTTETSPFLRLLVSADRERLPYYFAERTCQPGEVILRENAPGEFMYLIQAGRVSVVKGDLTCPVVLGFRGPGEIIGEMALLENQPRSASVIAIDTVRLLGISREKFYQMVEDNPTVGISMMALLSHRLRASDDARKADELRVNLLESETSRLQDLHLRSQATSDLVIHDLRNPISTILVTLRMLEASLPEDLLRENRELFEVADSGCNKLLKLANSLLQTSLFEENQVELQKSPVDVAELIRSVTRSAKLLTRKKIQMQMDLDASLPIIQADYDQIERVITNLLDNAIKYTPEGERIFLSAQLEGDHIVVRVTDSGPGIAPQDRERIFERYMQVGGEKRKGRGFGLGLAFCRLAVEAHQGKIWVEPAAPTGSCFIFTLPLK